MSTTNQLIETVYDEELVLQAEVLFENGAITDISKVNRNFFVAKIKDGKLYEIEIQSPFTKKQKVTCDCNFFSSNLICKHVITLLFHIRSMQSQKQLEGTKKSGPSTAKNTSLNIHQILNEISHDDLVTFMKAYASKDKKFATQLKVSFARKIEVEDGAMKYKNILNSIVRPYTGKQSKASASDVKAILSVLEDFADQINDCIALGQFRVAFDIFKSALSKLEYVRNYHLIYVDRQDALSHTYHKIIQTFREEKLPPELILEIKEYLLDVASLSYYHFKDYRHNVIYQLIPFLKANEKGNLLSSIENIITKKPAYEKNVLVSLWINISGKFSVEESSYVKSQCSSYVEVADYLIEDGMDHLAIKMFEKLYNTKKYVKDVTNRLLFLYVRSKNHPKLVQIVQIAYASTGEMKYIDILKDELNSIDYYAALDSIQKVLKDSSTDPKYLLRIYKKEGNWSGIILLLDQINDIDLTMQYDADLYKNEKKAVEELYSLLISRYLDTYIGDIAYDYLMLLRNHFNKRKMTGLTQTIHHLLKTKYAQRPKLIDIFA